MTTSAFIATPEEIIEEARNGRMFILIDDERRENEGDLIIPAQMATPDAVNFMARHGRGLICLALTREQVERLDLPPMSAVNGTLHQTAFTVSIEARDGITTGISAADRSRTIQAAIDPLRGAEAIVSPGHIFPLCAADGGVLVRAGHTEASIDVARLAGLMPAAVICEVLNEDGSMARTPDLVRFAERHGLKMGTIANLISFRAKTDRLIECAQTMPLATDPFGEWSVRVYRNKFTALDSLALVKGDLDLTAPVLVRMHTMSMADDMFGRSGARGFLLQASMGAIDAAGAGVIVLIRPTASSAFADILAQGVDAAPSGTPELGETVLRDYGIGAQILADLGVREMILLTNSSRHQLVGLRGYGLEVVEERPVAPMPLA